MISSVGSQQHGVPVQRVHKAEAHSDTAPPGKSGESVGHLAKASVLESGDTAPGAQGRAASRIARMDVTLLPPSSGAEDGSPPPGTETTGAGQADPDPAEA